MDEMERLHAESKMQRKALVKDISLESQVEQLNWITLLIDIVDKSKQIMYVKNLTHHWILN